MAAWAHDVAGRGATHEAMAKLFATEAALRIYEGASEVQKLVIARRHLAGDGR